jgi:lipopolysaccharide/colanic/teichoic acid biosynthesis glycosyltransferase
MHELDIEYVRHWSLWLDVKILVATLRAVVVDGEPIG